MVLNTKELIKTEIKWIRRGQYLSQKISPNLEKPHNVKVSYVRVWISCTVGVLLRTSNA